MLLKSLTGFAFFLLATAGLSSSFGQPDNEGKPDDALHVKVVSLEGCMATPPTIDLIRETADELKVQIKLAHVIVRTPDEAETHHHIGSPTVQINGLDIEPESRKIKQFGIT